MTRPNVITATSPPPKHPVFTKNFTSTKSFGPGHIVGAGILVLGIVGLTKLVIDRGKTEAERTRRLADQLRPRRPETEPTLAQVDNERGQYGNRP